MDMRITPNIMSFTLIKRIVKLLATNCANFRSVDDDEANQLLLNLVLEEEVRGKVKNFLRDKKSRGHKQKKKKRPQSQNSTRAAAAATNRGTTPSSGTRQPMLAPTPPAHPQKKKQNTQPTPNKSGPELQSILSAVSNDEHDTLHQQQPSVLPRTPESIKQFLYDDNGKLSADIISVIGEDKNYMLLERKGTREEKVSAVMEFIAPRSQSITKTLTGLQCASTSLKRLYLFGTHKA